MNKKNPSKKVAPGCNLNYKEIEQAFCIEKINNIKKASKQQREVQENGIRLSYRPCSSKYI